MVLFFRTIRVAVIVAFVGAMYGCATPTQLVYDAEVDKLCAQNGIHIYEQVKLPESAFDENGYPFGFRPANGPDALGPDYLFEFTSTYIKGSSVSDSALSRSSSKVYRKADNKLLGEDNHYTRRGGDFLWGHPSAHSCATYTDIVKQIFLRQPPNKK